MIKGGMDTGGERRRAAARPRLTPIEPMEKAIIEQLQQDGRRPYAEIAASLGATEEDVERRVRDLVERGVMQIVAVTDPLQMGYARQAMLGLTVEGPVAPVLEALAAIEQVVYVVATGGDFDVVVEVIGNSDAHLLELVASRIRPVPGVRSIHTFLYLQLAKQTYTWGVR